MQQYELLTLRVPHSWNVSLQELFGVNTRYSKHLS